MAALLKTTDVRCRIDEDLKARATEVLNACGLSISDAMRLFLRQVVATQGFPSRCEFHRRRRPAQ